MSYITIFGISAGLAMDAFAVSISYGCTPKKVPVKHILLIAFSFGLFQAFMPVIGWNMGRFFADLIKDYDHWVAFSLLAYIGVRMIIEGLKTDKNDDSSCEMDDHILDLKRLFVLSVATSIDALAVGLSLSLLGYEIITPAIIIGVTTFIFSFIGVKMGCRLHRILGKRVEVFGGVVLIAIGLKIIIEHMY
ncbi:MAG: manganese efflux pump [Spirochaetae bacterium HGW-Spirochaetae-5]|nr:MAG: manganese efflux pump [Spirochaetae bacterium HGW-Spirochaetae-5]